MTNIQPENIAIEICKEKITNVRFVLPELVHNFDSFCEAFWRSPEITQENPQWVIYIF